MLPKDSKIEAKFEPNLLGGVTTLNGKATLKETAKDNSPSTPRSAVKEKKSISKPSPTTPGTTGNPAAS